MAHSQAARVHEVDDNENGSDTVASRLAEHGERYIKVVAGLVGAFKAPYDISTPEGKILSWAYLNRAASTANAALTQGKESKLDDAGKRAYLTAYLNGGYTFTSDLGSEFSMSLLEIAADRVVFELGVAQGKLSGAYSDHASTDERTKRAGVVKKILTDPSLADKYESRVRSMIETILNEKHAVRTRGAKKDESLDLEV